MPKKKVQPEIDHERMPRKAPRNGPGSQTRKRVEWEPTARQWAVYEAVRRGGSYRYVGSQFKVTFQAVADTCKRIDNYLAAMYIDRVRELRIRHTEHLEHIFCEAMAAWEKSKEHGVTIQTETVTFESSENGETSMVPAEKKRRSEKHQVGDAKFLKEARGALADIRRIHAVDKNPNLVEVADGSGDRVAGKDRESLIQERINALNASLKVSQSLRAAEQAG